MIFISGSKITKITKITISFVCYFSCFNRILFRRFLLNRFRFLFLQPCLISDNLYLRVLWALKGLSIIDKPSFFSPPKDIFKTFLAALVVCFLKKHEQLNIVCIDKCNDTKKEPYL